MTALRAAIDQAFDHYVARRRADEPGLSLGTGAGHDVRLFDRDLLFSAQTRFALAGIVNRMDRGLSRAGELRRDSADLSAAANRRTGARIGAASALLPMTLNLVLRAARADGEDRQQRCADAARRWLDAAEWPQAAPNGPIGCVAPDGPLHALTPDAIDRIEINLQIAHTPQSASRGVPHRLSGWRASAISPRAGASSRRCWKTRSTATGCCADDATGAGVQALAAGARATRRVRSRHDHDPGPVPGANARSRATPVGFAPSQRQPAFGLVSSGPDKPALFERCRYRRRLARGGRARRRLRDRSARRPALRGG